MRGVVDNGGSQVDTRFMGATRWRVDRLAEDVAVLGGRGLPREQYFAELSARLRRVMDCDATCWHTLDPQTRLMTSDAPQELIDRGVFTAEAAAAAAQLLIASEYLVDDANTFGGLARRRVPVGILSDATGGRPERSARYRNLLAPAGIPFELRAAFVSRGRAWGAVHVARRDDKEDFTHEDVAVLARIGAVIAEGIRTSLRFDAARRPRVTGAPGLVVLSASDEVQLITAPAHALLDCIRSPALRETEETPPAPLLALAAFTRTRAHDDEQHPAVLAVPAGDGWITLHASLPEGRADGAVAIVLERASGPQVRALRLEAHGVTPREREVAALLARGLSNPEIAATLVLSPYTVSDHVKSLFEKTCVSSRQELVARVFLDDYLPHVAGGAPLASDGGFANCEPAPTVTASTLS